MIRYPVARPLLMYTFFGYVKEVDSHNKPRQSDLDLEKFLVTPCFWIQLCITVDTLITITIFGNYVIMVLRDITIKINWYQIILRTTCS